MTALHLAATELRRLLASTLGKLAILALALVPAIYAGFYLYANKDPYAGFSRVPAAIVVEDQGTTLATGERLDAGATVSRNLLQSKSFDWQPMDRATAEQRVRAGDDDFAIIVPPTFSADLASSAQLTPRPASLELLTNDANNYTAHTIANQVVAEVTKSVASQVSQTAASQLLLGFTQIHDKTAAAVDGSAQVHDGLVSARSGAGQLAAGSDALVAGEQQLVDGSQQLTSGATSLASGLATLDGRTRDLPAQTRRLADGAAQVSAGNQQVASAATQVGAGVGAAHAALTTDRSALLSRLRADGLTPAQLDSVNAELDRLAGPLDQADAQVGRSVAQLDQLAAGSKQVADGAASLAAAAGPLHDGIAQASTGATQVRDGASRLDDGAVAALGGARQLSTGAHQLDGGLAQLADGAGRLHDGLASGLTQIPDPDAAQRTAVAQTLGAPVTVSPTSMSSAGNYGGGLAPFFLSLSLWIGAYVLFLLVKPLSSRALAANASSLRVALGGWLAPAAVGAVQVLAVFGIVAGLLRIDVAHPVATVGFMGVVSMTFVAILHALAARFGTVGKFLGLVFMVVQLVSAGGTFPWQTLPGPLQALHQVLPMGYAVDGLRRLMYGADLGALATDLTVLGAYLVGALVLSSLTARRARVWTPARLKPELTL